MKNYPPCSMAPDRAFEMAARRDPCLLPQCSSSKTYFLDSNGPISQRAGEIRRPPQAKLCPVIRKHRKELPATRVLPNSNEIINPCKNGE